MCSSMRCSHFNFLLDEASGLISDLTLGHFKFHGLQLPDLPSQPDFVQIYNSRPHIFKWPSLRNSGLGNMNKNVQDTFFKLHLFEQKTKEVDFEIILGNQLFILILLLLFLSFYSFFSLTLFLIKFILYCKQEMRAKTFSLVADIQS